MLISTPRGGVSSVKSQGVRLFAPLVLALVMTAGSNTVNAADPALSWGFEVGKTTFFQLRQVNTTNTSANGREIPLNTELTLDFSWKVVKIEDGKAQIEHILQRARTSVDSPMAQFVFDSSAKDDPADPNAKTIAGLYRSIVDKPIQITLSSQGEFLEVKMPQEVKDGIPDALGQGIRDSGSMFSEAGIKNLLVQLIPTLPKAALEAGKGWEASIPLGMPPLGKLKLDQSFKYEGVKDGLAQLVAKVDTSIEPDPNSPIKLKLKEQSGKQSVKFDMGKKVLDSSSIELNMVLDLTVPNQDAPIGQVLKIDAKLVRRDEADLK